MLVMPQSMEALRDVAAVTNSLVSHYPGNNPHQLQELPREELILGSTITLHGGGFPKTPLGLPAVFSNRACAFIDIFFTAMACGIPFGLSGTARKVHFGMTGGHILVQLATNYNGTGSILQNLWREH